jgi:hypothetical protein
MGKFNSHNKAAPFKQNSKIMFLALEVYCGDKQITALKFGAALVKCTFVTLC